tara:strand:+ start:9600 stop:9977 length:378 start_codon:yes stop_codon:yes gene_type:complete
MEIFIVVVVGGLLFLAFQLGGTMAWENFGKRQNEIVPANMEPFSDFHQIFGFSGFFLSNLNEKIEDPLVVISTADFTRLVARSQLSSEASDKELDDRAKELSNRWLKEVEGFSDEKIRALESWNS